MVRIYKHYEFALASPHHKMRRTSFSSYPGELSSDDDFYLIDTGLALLQTTNDILDTELYKLLTPKSVLNWQRVRYEAISPQPLLHSDEGPGVAKFVWTPWEHKNVLEQACQCNGHIRE